MADGNGKNGNGKNGNGKNGNGAPAPGQLQVHLPRPTPDLCRNAAAQMVMNRDICQRNAKLGAANIVVAESFMIQGRTLDTGSALMNAAAEIIERLEAMRVHLKMPEPHPAGVADEDQVEDSGSAPPS